MSDKLILTLEQRDVIGKAVRRLRLEGQTPAVLYGHGSEPQTVTINSRELEKVFQTAGGNRIIGVKMGDGRPRNALIHDVQTDARTGLIQHIDLYLVRMDEKIKTEVPIHVTGESTAVYQQEGTLIRPLETVQVEALPADLPESFEIDISILDDFDKTITVGDLKIPNGVEVLTAAEDVVAKVEAPRSEEEMEELDAPIDEAAELPEEVIEDQEVIVEEQETRKEPQNRADAA